MAATAPTEANTGLPETHLDDDDLYENGLFVVGDGLRLSAPWRLGNYGFVGALSDEQIEALSERFGIDVDVVRQLSISLGAGLDPERSTYLVPMRRSTAAARAKTTLRKIRTDVAVATENVQTAVEALFALYPNAPGDPEGAAFLVRTREQLAQCFRDLESVTLALDRLEEAKDPALTVAPTDRRAAVDYRRQRVLRAIFQCWYDSGIERTYSTDPTTSKRAGPLIDFANAVVALVTDPPSQLSANTIATAYGTFKPMTRAFLEEFKALWHSQSQDTP